MYNDTGHEYSIALKLSLGIVSLTPNYLQALRVSDISFMALSYTVGHFRTGVENNLLMVNGIFAL